MKNYDAVIIGGGAGLKIARPAAKLGYKIAVVEEKHLGGTCLNRGCIPSKMLIHPADVVQQMRESELYNISFEGKVNIDIQQLVGYVNKTVDEESQSIYPLFQNQENIDLYTERAQFVDDYTLQIGEQKIRGDKVFIASGARPSLPDIAGLKNTPFMTSTELLRRTELPSSVIILGGGYIACELGHYLDAMGVKVHFVIRSKFLKDLDHDVQDHFQTIFEKRFQVTQMTPSQISYEKGLFTVEDEKNKLTAHGLLVATGVTPNSDILHLAKTGVKCNPQGFIQVNNYLETSKPGIFAFGDVIGRYMFRHSANFEGEYLLSQHFEKKGSKGAILYPPVPYGVFTWPQIGGVGKIERELKEEKRDYIVGLNYYRNSAMGMALRKDEGFVKLLFDAKTLKLLGGHIIGEQATTMIHMIIAYMNMGATLGDLLKTIYVHPALSENIRNAARKAKEELNKRA